MTESGKLSEKQWLRKRRDAVTALTPPAKQLKKKDLDNIWTPAHDKELQFNLSKQWTHIWEGMRSNTVLPAEVGADEEACARENFQKVPCNDKRLPIRSLFMCKQYWQPLFCSQALDHEMHPTTFEN